MNTTHGLRASDATCQVPLPISHGRNPKGARHEAPAVMVVVLLLCLGSPADGSAQHATTRGWVLILDLGGAAISFEDSAEGIYLAEAWALDVNFKWTKGRYRTVRERDRLQVGGFDITADTVRFTVGVSWWP